MIVTPLLSVVDVIVATEANVREYAMFQYSLTGFENFVTTRSGRTGGGIAVYVKKTVDCVSF